MTQTTTGTPGDGYRTTPTACRGWAPGPADPGQRPTCTGCGREYAPHHLPTPRGASR